MLLVRRFAAATALLLIAVASFILPFAGAVSPAEAGSDVCGDAAGLTVLPSPVAPWKGAPLRVMVVAEEPVEGVLSLVAPDGSVAARSPDRQIARPPRWSAALFLVRRGRRTGRRDVACDADARACAVAMRPDDA
jgi:hypothetical protein